MSTQLSSYKNYLAKKKAENVTSNVFYDVRVMIHDNGHYKWIKSRNYQEEAFIEYKNQKNKYIYNYNKNGFIFDIIRNNGEVFSIRNDSEIKQHYSNGNTFLRREDGSSIPITDFSKVKALVKISNGKKTLDVIEPSENLKIAYYTFLYSQFSTKYVVFCSSKNNIVELSDDMKDNVTIVEYPFSDNFVVTFYVQNNLIFYNLGVDSNDMLNISDDDYVIRYCIYGTNDMAIFGY